MARVYQEAVRVSQTALLQPFSLPGLPSFWPGYHPSPQVKVGDVNVLTGSKAQAVQQEARQAVLFTATIPGSTEGRYGLASAGEFSWSWTGAVVVSDVRVVGKLHAIAADLGLEVAEVCAGMIFTSKKNAQGVIETEQRQAFDWSNF